MKSQFKTIITNWLLSFKIDNFHNLFTIGAK